MGGPARIGNGSQNRFGDSIGILPYLAVPESHDAPAELFEKARPRFIPLIIFDMLATVDFDGDPRRSTSEIKDIAPDRKLARESRTGVAQALP